MDVNVTTNFDNDLERWRDYMLRMTDEERRAMRGFLRRELGVEEEQKALPSGEG